MTIFGIKNKSKLNRAGDNAKSDLSMGNNQIERVANATKTGDAIPWGQAAGGDMGCTYPNITILPATELVAQTTSNTTLGLRDGANDHTKIAQQVASGLKNISKCVFKLSKSGSPSGTVYAEIYSDSSDLPNTLLATSNESYNCAEILASEADFTFTFPHIATCPVSASAKQHIVLAGTYTESPSVYVKAGMQATGGTGASWWNGIVWTSLTPMNSYHYAYYGDSIL